MLHRGKITNIDIEGYYVTVPTLGVGTEFGPCEYPPDVTFAIGDRVVVGQIGEFFEDLVIISKLA